MSCGQNKGAGGKSAQLMVDQKPIFDSRRFKKRLKAGRPPKGANVQHWVK